MARPEEALAAIPLETRHFEDLGRYLLRPMLKRVRVAQQHAGGLLVSPAGRTVWMVNSTALGGGVAQLLRTLLPYWKGAGIDVRWVVLRGSGEFFRVTKRCGRAWPASATSSSAATPPCQNGWAGRRRRS